MAINLVTQAEAHGFSSTNHRFCLEHNGLQVLAAYSSAPFLAVSPFFHMTSFFNGITGGAASTRRSLLHKTQVKNNYDE